MTRRSFLRSSATSCASGVRLPEAREHFRQLLALELVLPALEQTPRDAEAVGHVGGRATLLEQRDGFLLELRREGFLGKVGRPRASATRAALPEAGRGSITRGRKR